MMMCYNFFVGMCSRCSELIQWHTCPMIMCYNFFVVMYSRCSELIQFKDKRRIDNYDN